MMKFDKIIILSYVNSDFICPNYANSDPRLLKEVGDLVVIAVAKAVRTSANDKTHALKDF